MILSLAPASVLADTTQSITVNVSIASKGTLQVAHEEIEVTDYNSSGSYDIDDVLYAAHNEYYSGDAQIGYASAASDYGLGITTLWGDTSGAFGYYVNNNSAWSLADPVTDGDYVYAFVYKDQTGWSDAYTYFTSSTTSIKKGQTLEVTLNKLGYDDSWATVELPVENAAIKINGENTDYRTNAEGVAQIVFENTGNYTLTAEFAGTENYTPPVYVVNVTENTDTQTPPPDEATENPDTPTDNEEKDYDVLIPEVLENISATYTNKTDEWTVMDMGAYLNYAPQTENKLTDKARQTFINSAIKTIQDSYQAYSADTAIDKAVLGLVAIGKDPQSLYSVNSNTPISAIEKLNGAEKSTSAWSAPYTLAAYNQGEYNTDSYETALVDALLLNQKVDGSWDEWGTIDTTANVIAGLSFYKDREEVRTAIDKAVAYLSTQQAENGTFSDGYSGPNSNSTAMVVIGLCAAGVDLVNDTRFINSGNNIIDGLLSFLVADKNGFGYTDNTSINSYSTEQAFRALIALAQTIKTGEAYNIYDFSKNELTPARATGTSTSSSTPSEPTGDNITVTMTIKADTGYWLRNYSTTIPGDGATVYDAFIKACGDWNITHKGAAKGYVSSITKDNVTLGEFDKGENSGWLYKVNGELPQVGLTDCSINNGDNIVWYYTEDWTKDTSAKHYGSPSTVIDKTENNSVEPTDIPNNEGLALFTDIADHWAFDAIEYVYNHSIMEGFSETEFAPDNTMTRAMLVTVLYRLENPTEKAKSHSFTDIKDGEWYSDAVSWAAENGIIDGVTETEFAPDEDITREQMATVLYRYAQYKNQDTSVGEDTNILSYTDAEEISEYAIPAIQWMAGAGLMDGETESTINPLNNSTRAQVATILMRYLEQ